MLAPVKFIYTGCNIDIEYYFFLLQKILSSLTMFKET